MMLSQRVMLRSMIATVFVSMGCCSPSVSFLTVATAARRAPSGLRSSWLTVPVNCPSAARRSLRTNSSCAARSSLVRSFTRRSRRSLRS